LWLPAQIESFQLSVFNNIDQIVKQLQAAGAKVVLASPIDFGVMPVTRVNMVYTDPVKRQRVTDVMQQFDDWLRQIATERGVPFVDMFAFGERVFGTQAAPNSQLQVGGVPIHVLQAGVAPTNGFVDDNQHEHTVIHGLMANLFLEALQQGYHTDVPLLTEEEIVHAAGLDFAGNTLPFSASDFVTNYTSANVVAATAVYVVLDNVSASQLDNLGDAVGNVISVRQRNVGEEDSANANRVARLVTKFELPNSLDAIDRLQSATLRFFLKGIEGIPVGPLSLRHSTSDNDLDLNASDYEDASYTDTLLDLLQPSDAAGSYYELEVTDLVLADYASDGARPLSAFRLQIDEASFLENNLSNDYLLITGGGGRPELLLTFIPVPEPPTSILAAMALLSLIGRVSRRASPGCFCQTPRI
jgi:hypothetical protein